MTARKRQTAKRPGPLVEIDWVDSCATSGWQGDSAPDGSAAECKTVGYLIHRSKAVVTVAQNADNQGGTGAWMTIPCHCVRRIKRHRS